MTFLKSGFTLVLGVIVAPLFGALPLVAAASLDHLSAIGNPNILEVARVFGYTVLGAYVFGIPYGLWQSLAIGTVLSTFGILGRGIGVTALAIAILAGLSLGIVIFWRGLINQNHPNAAGAMFLNPAIFAACHFFLAASSWVMARSIWRQGK